MSWIHLQFDTMMEGQKAVTTVRERNTRDDDHGERQTTDHLEQHSRSYIYRWGHCGPFNNKMHSTSEWCRIGLLSPVSVVGPVPGKESLWKSKGCILDFSNPQSKILLKRSTQEFQQWIKGSCISPAIGKHWSDLKLATCAQKNGPKYLHPWMTGG